MKIITLFYIMEFYINIIWLTVLTNSFICKNVLSGAQIVYYLLKICHAANIIIYKKISFCNIYSCFFKRSILPCNLIIVWKQCYLLFFEVQLNRINSVIILDYIEVVCINESTGIVKYLMLFMCFVSTYKHNYIT